MNSSFKILQVITTNRTEAGGTVEGIRQLYNPLKNINIHSTILTSLKNKNNYFEKNNLQTISLNSTNIGYGFNISIFFWLIKNSHKYDCIIIEGLWQFHSLATYLSSIITKKPYLIFTHGMLDKWFITNNPKKSIYKKIYWELFEKKVINNSKMILFTSNEERAASINTFEGFSATSSIVGYGINAPPKINVIKKIMPEKINILFLSRIHEKKGLDILIKCVRKLIDENYNIHLNVAGDISSNYAEEMMKLSNDMNLKKDISWLGMLEGEKKWKAYHECDIFCLPSHQENFGVVVAEALACGTPVIISNKVYIWQEIQKYNAGIVDDDTIEGTMRSIKKWITMSSTEKNSMQNNTVNCYRDNFTAESCASKIKLTIQNIIEGQK